jgi:fructose-1,6-bisphosphatase I
MGSGVERQMTNAQSVGVDLSTFLVGQTRPELTRVIESIAAASLTIVQIIRRGQLAGALGASMGATNQDGDAQKALDVIADERFMAVLRDAGVAGVVSEERPSPEIFNPKGSFLVAIDPLDGSSNIDTNASIGTIFSILPAPAAGTTSDDAFLQRGNAPLAAGFVIYGPQTSIIFSTGNGTHIATHDPDTNRFFMTRIAVTVPSGATEYAINASNYLHWHQPVQSFIDDCVNGAEGPRGTNFNMRWLASLVADAYRIFVRGGIFLYPADTRKGYERGRLRHLYEANPIAFLIEQAGGAATDGVNRILDIAPHSVHDRIPLVFGSLDKVERVRRYHLEEEISADRMPLFGKSGLLRN